MEKENDLAGAFCFQSDPTPLILLMKTTVEVGRFWLLATERKLDSIKNDIFREPKREK